LPNKQENGSNAVEGDTEDGSSLTIRQQVGSNDTQGTNATPTSDEPGAIDTPMVDEKGINDTPTTDEPGIVSMTHLPLVNHINHKCVIGNRLMIHRCVIDNWFIIRRCVIGSWLSAVDASLVPGSSVVCTHISYLQNW
jgi:hypothetical protein